MWYSVHAFLYFQFKDGSQDEYFGHENIYLIEAESPEEAQTKGKKRAKQDEGDDDGSLTLNDRPATRTLGGILKVVECTDLDLDTDKPVDGTELTYSDLILPNKHEFDKFVSGRSSTLVYLGFDEDD